MARLSTAAAEEAGRDAERIELFGSEYEQVIRTQQLYQEATGPRTAGDRPVTNRGDAIGLLELLAAGRARQDILERSGEPRTPWPTS